VARTAIDRARETLSADHPEVLKAEARWISEFRPDEEVRRRPVVAALVAEMERGSEDPQLPLALARLVATGESPDEALLERALRRRLLLAPDDLRPYADLARLLLSNGQEGAAAELADTLLERSVANSDGRRQAAAILQATGRREAAIDIVRELVATESLEQDRLTLAAMLREGDDDADRAEAGRILLAAADRPGASLEAVVQAADWEIADGRAADAIRRIEARHAASGDLDLPVMTVRLWLVAGEVDAADAAAEALVALGRTDTAATATIADWLTARGRIDEAVALVRERLISDPEQPALLVWAADRSSHPGWRYDEVPALREAIAVAAPGLLALSELQRDATRDDGGLAATPELLERALALVETHPRLAAAWRTAVVLHNVAGRREEAIDLARRGTTEAPQSAILQQLLAELLIQAGRPSDARLALSTLAELPDHDPRRVAILEAESALALGDADGAIEAVALLEAVDPDATAIRAAANLDLGNTAAAIALLGDDPARLAALGVGRVPGMTPEAARAFVEALAPLRASNPRLCIDLANGLLQCHTRTNDSGLLDLADRVLTEAPQGQPTTVLVQGDVVAARGNPREAIALYREAIEAIPAADREALERWAELDRETRERLASARVIAASALNNMAYRQCEAGGVTTDTLDLIERALTLLPDNPALRDTRALVLLELDRLPEARAEAEAAAMGLPDDPTVRLTLARILQRSEAFAAARREVAAALAILARTPDAQPELRRKLERLDRVLQRAAMTPATDRTTLPSYLEGATP
jgi:tetratricopeptide (TPR) repeat protein